MDSMPDFKIVYSALKKLCSYRLYLKKNEEVIIIRSNVKEMSDVERFVDLYQILTHTRFNVLQSKHMTRYVFRKQWVCHFCGRNKRKLDYGCRASIDILIKKVNRSTSRNDPFLKLKPPLHTVITIHYPHTHPLLEKPFLRKNRMSNEIKKIFYEYFEHGIVGMHAKKLHVKLLREINFPYMDDQCINPRLDRIYRLHKLWLKGSPENNNEPDLALEKEEDNLQLKNLKKEDTCHDDFVSHVKETITGLTKFPEEPSIDEFDIDNIKMEVVEDLKCKHNFSTENGCAKNAAENLMCCTIASSYSIKLNQMMRNLYRPIMPKAVPKETNSKIVLPVNNKMDFASINSTVFQTTKVSSQKPIIFSKYGVMKVNAIMIRNINS